jgi:hypothetical protein
LALQVTSTAAELKPAAAHSMVNKTSDTVFFMFFSLGAARCHHGAVGVHPAAQMWRKNEDAQGSKR